MNINWYGLIGVILMNLIGLNIGYSYIINKNEIKHEYNHNLFYIIFFSSLNWILYSIIILDHYIFLSCISSLICTFGFMQILYTDLYINKSSKLLWIEIWCCIYMIFIFVLVYLYYFMFIISIELITKILGISSMILSIATNISPMLILYEVIQTSNVEKIYLPQALIGLFNLIVWLIYSIIIDDIFQIITNAICGIMCLLQCIVYCYYSYIK